MKNNQVMVGLTTGRAAVLEALREQPDPVSIEALSRVLGRHHNTVREQVTWLVDHGLVQRLRKPTEGRGRPPWLYEARGPRPGDDDYVELAAALAWTIQGSNAEEAREQALAAGLHWAEQLAAGRDAHPLPSARAARQRTLELLEDLGYEPTADARIDRVVLHRCPMLQAAHQFPDVVCSVHLGLLRGTLAAHGGDPDRAQLTPFAAPGECRARLLAPRQD